MRRDVLRSRLNRELASVELLVLVVQLAYGDAAVLKIPGETTQTILSFVWFVFFALLGVAFERRWLVPAVAFLAAFFVGARDPRMRLVAEPGANFVLTLTGFFAWRDRGSAPIEP